MVSIYAAPTFDPVGLVETKDRLRISNEDEDAQILSMIKSATLFAEMELKWRLCEQTWDYYLQGWPSGDVIRLPYPPLQSIGSIKYYDSNNVQQTLSASEYDVNIYSKPALIQPVNGWPSYYDRFNPIVIRFTCGYESADLIPEDIKDAILLRVADLYAIRQNTITVTGATVSKQENTITSCDILSRYKLYNEPCI